MSLLIYSSQTMEPAANKAEIPVGAWNRRHEKHVKSHKQAHEPASSSNILRKLLLRFTVIKTEKSTSLRLNIWLWGEKQERWVKERDRKAWLVIVEDGDFRVNSATLTATVPSLFNAYLIRNLQLSIVFLNQTAYSRGKTTCQIPQNCTKVQSLSR